MLISALSISPIRRSRSNLKGGRWGMLRASSAGPNSRNQQCQYVPLQRISPECHTGGDEARASGRVLQCFQPPDLLRAGHDCGRRKFRTSSEHLFGSCPGGPDGVEVLLVGFETLTPFFVSLENISIMVWPKSKQQQPLASCFKAGPTIRGRAETGSAPVRLRQHDTGVKRTDEGRGARVSTTFATTLAIKKLSRSATNSLLWGARRSGDPGLLQSRGLPTTARPRSAM